MGKLPNVKSTNTGNLSETGAVRVVGCLPLTNIMSHFWIRAMSISTRTTSYCQSCRRKRNPRKLPMKMQVPTLPPVRQADFSRTRSPNACVTQLFASSRERSPSTLSYTPTTPMHTPKGMTPPELNPLSMRPSPVEASQPPSRETEGGSMPAQDSSSNVPVRLLPKREPSQQSHSEGSPTKVPRAEVPQTRISTRGADEGDTPTKVQRIGTSGAALEQIQESACNGEWENNILSVLNLLDTELDPREVEKAKEVRMATGSRMNSFVKDFFQYKWVDEIKRGAYRSRFTCADVKRKN